MKSREELDAIRALGLDPIELLVVPRLLALLVMLPLLSFLAMLSGLLAGEGAGGWPGCIRSIWRRLRSTRCLPAAGLIRLR